MKKLTCIIVDDELRICQLINKLGNWEELGIEVTAICHDGESAVNEICMRRPDIVLSDIKLPIYDGIQIIEHIHKKGLNPLFIIISGYSYFEYAQRAIQLGAIDYLVKPINKEKLNEVLQRCVILLNKRSQQEAESMALVEAHRDLLWRDLLSHKFRCHTSEEFRSIYGANWSDINHWVAVIQVSSRELSDNKALFFDRIVSILFHMFRKGTYTVDGSHGYIYLIFNQYETFDVSERLQKLFMEIKYLEGNLGNFALTIGYSNPFTGVAELPLFLQQACKATDWRFEQGSDAIIPYSQLPDGTYSSNAIITETFTNNLIYQTNLLDSDKMNEAINLLKDEFLKSRERDFSGILDVGIHILNTVMNTTQYPEQEFIRDELRYGYHFCTDYDQFFNLLVNLAKRIIEKKCEEEHVELSSQVKAVKEFVTNHYADKIYLDDLARYVCRSPAYLSAIFKKETGVVITEYINTVRCEVAKDLLKNKKLSNAAIADKIGFSDDKYFLHQFKKVVGITPSQFRRLHS